MVLWLFSTTSRYVSCLYSIALIKSRKRTSGSYTITVVMGRVEGMMQVGGGVLTRFGRYHTHTSFQILISNTTLLFSIPNSQKLLIWLCLMAVCVLVKCWKFKAIRLLFRYVLSLVSSSFVLNYLSRSLKVLQVSMPRLHTSPSLAILSKSLSLKTCWVVFSMVQANLSIRVPRSLLMTTWMSMVYSLPVH